MLDGQKDTPFTGNEIAIIGMAGRFPGARNIEEFWQNIQAGVESISFFTDEELLAAGIPQETLEDSHYVKAYGAIAEIDQFDASFFGYSRREAELIDPQQRLFLECAWQAIEAAGYDVSRFPGSIGVFGGVSANHYLLLNLLSQPELLNNLDKLQIFLGNEKDYLTTRVSYKLNLRGASYDLQTACSTSLVAVHVACQSLLSGECDMVLAGGVSARGIQKGGYWYREGGTASPDGHCRPFDGASQGTLNGDGVGIVILRRLADALDAGDHIEAVIKGSAINNDGSLKVSFTAPSVQGQSTVVSEALAMAEVSPETIGYIEAHGTGTQIGDPIEIEALSRAFAATTEKKQFCALGSVKGNIGHLDAGAGIAGLIKTVLALKHNIIPPMVHFQAPNPRIDLASSPFYIATAATAWPQTVHPRRAGVTSLGMGGTNVHVILEETPERVTKPPTREHQLLLLSAQSSTALKKTMENLLAYLQNHPDARLEDVAYTLQVGRKVFTYKQALVCQSREDVLAAWDDPVRLLTEARETGERTFAFLFPGQGTHYIHMAQGLYLSEPVFREKVDYCAKVLLPLLGIDLRTALYPDDAQRGQAQEALNQTWLTQPALFVVEYALAHLWMSWGIKPGAMLGHSIGEYVAACLAGVFTLEDALTLIAFRGKLMQQLPPGAMLVVNLAKEEIHQYLNSELSLAAVNGPTQCVVSGSPSAIEACMEQLSAQEIKHIRLQTSHAFHSSMVEPILAKFATHLEQIQFQVPVLRYISNLTGDWITTEEATSRDYWVQHLRQTVLFAQGLTTLTQEPGIILLEVGPGQSLTRMSQRYLRKELDQFAIPSLGSDGQIQADRVVLLNGLARLWLNGVIIDWEMVHAHEQRYRLALPTYPFEHQRYWLEPSPIASAASPLQATGQKLPLENWFYAPSWKQAPLLPSLSTEPLQAGCWLLFGETSGLSEHIAANLKRAGQRVIMVLQGEHFECCPADAYRIAPLVEDDYTRLLEHLEQIDCIPTDIVHLWSVTSPTDQSDDLESSDALLSQCFHSLRCLAQALGKRVRRARLELHAISTNMHDVMQSSKICPEKACMLGICNVLPQEDPFIQCRSIDIALDLSNDQQGQKAANQLCQEMLVKSANPTVAYYGDHRWLPTFEQISLPARSFPAPLLKRGGVYLITGGLGGIGLVLAGYLADQLQAQLILVGRSEFPLREQWADWLTSHDAQNPISQKIRQCYRLEESGARVFVASADVLDLEAMQRVVEVATERFGSINGVIHAAGIAGGGIIQQKTRRFSVL